MERTSTFSVTTIVSVLLVVAVLAGFAAWHFSAPGQQTEQDLGTWKPARAMELRHTFAQGTHTYEGVIDVPGCQTIESELIPESVDPIRLRLELNTQAASGACADPTPVPQLFSSSITPAKADAVVSIDAFAVNGAPAEYKLVEQN
jgi:hypothetical protein